jgi:hypothetical protein
VLEKHPGLDVRRTHMRNLPVKVVITIGVLLALLVVMLPGCGEKQNQSTAATTGTSSDTTTTTTSATSDTTTEVTTLPYEFDTNLTISSAPKLGETVDLTFTVDIIKLDASHPREGLANSKAWIDFYWTNTKGSYSEAYSSVQIPLDQVLVDGNLSWEGSYSKGFTLKGKFKLPREGIWSIVGRFNGEGWNSGGAGADLEVAVADGTAAIMGTEDFKNGPLAYMGNNSYAGGVRGPTFANEMYPVSLGLDISKAPRAGEDVTLSCRINSLIDVSDFSIYWSFSRRLGDTTQEIPVSELLSSKDLAWRIDIKKGEPVVFSTTIKFPSEGDWEISASGKSGAKYLTGSGHQLKLSITSTRSYFGWIERALPPVTITGTTGITTTAHTTTTQP